MVTVAMLVVLAALGFMPQREQVISAMKQILPMDQATSTKITVYQSQGQKGEMVFSDQKNAAHAARPRVVDTAKGMTIHMDVTNEVKASKEPNASQYPSTFQQQAEKIKHLRMERVINDE